MLQVTGRNKTIVTENSLNPTLETQCSTMPSIPPAELHQTYHEPTMFVNGSPNKALNKTKGSRACSQYQD